MIDRSLFLNPGEKIDGEKFQSLLDKLEVVLPAEYKEFIVNINGGDPKDNFFELRKFDPEESNTNRYIVIDHFLHYSELEQVYRYTNEDLAEFFLFPIADVRGGMLLCCKQAPSEYCEMFLFDNNFGVLKLTDSLQSFLNLLIPPSEVDYKKYGIDFE